MLWSLTFMYLEWRKSSIIIGINQCDLYLTATNPCGIDNGGCSHLCLMSPVKFLSVCLPNWGHTPGEWKKPAKMVRSWLPRRKNSG